MHSLREFRTRIAFRSNPEMPVPFAIRELVANHFLSSVAVAFVIPFYAPLITRLYWILHATSFRSE
jgi:hypothetical protein